jgi:hypothetical protein
MFSFINAAAGKIELSTAPTTQIGTAQPTQDVIARVSCGSSGQSLFQADINLPVDPFQNLYVHQTGAGNLGTVTLSWALAFIQNIFVGYWGGVIQPVIQQDCFIKSVTFTIDTTTGTDAVLFNTGQQPGYSPGTGIIAAVGNAPTGTQPAFVQLTDLGYPVKEGMKLSSTASAMVQLTTTPVG